MVLSWHNNRLTKIAWIAYSSDWSPLLIVSCKVIIAAMYATSIILVDKHVTWPSTVAITIRAFYNGVVHGMMDLISIFIDQTHTCEMKSPYSLHSHTHFPKRERPTPVTIKWSVRSYSTSCIHISNRPLYSVHNLSSEDDLNRSTWSPKR